MTAPTLEDVLAIMARGDSPIPASEPTAAEVEARIETATAALVALGWTDDDFNALATRPANEGCEHDVSGWDPHDLGPEHVTYESCSWLHALLLAAERPVPVAAQAPVAVVVGEPVVQATAQEPAVGPDKDAWLSQWQVLYGHHTWPEDAVLAISGPATNWKADFAPVSDPEAVWDLVERVHHFDDAYVRITPMHSSVAARGKGRGKAADSIATSVLFIDVDTKDGVHKPKKPLPSYKEAGALVRGLAKPSLIVATGGGVHCYYALDTLLPLYEDGVKVDREGKRILDQFADRWESRFDGAGFAYDAGVARDAGRVLRIAGTFNRKRGRVPVRLLEVNADAVYSLADIEALCPPKQVVTTQRAARDGVRAAARYVGGNTARKVNAEVPIDMLLAEVWGMEEVEGGRWLYPDPVAGLTYVGSDSSAQVWPADEHGVHAVTAFSSRLQEAWGVSDERHAMRAWDLVCIAFDGNAAAAKDYCLSTLNDHPALVAGLRALLGWSNRS